MPGPVYRGVGERCHRFERPGSQNSRAASISATPISSVIVAIILTGLGSVSGLPRHGKPRLSLAAKALAGVAPFVVQDPWRLEYRTAQVAYQCSPRWQAASGYLKENLSEPVCRKWPPARSGGVLCSQRDAPRRGDSTEAVGGRSHSVCWDGDAQIPSRRESSVPGRTGRSICDFRDL